MQSRTGQVCAALCFLAICVWRFEPAAELESASDATMVDVVALTTKYFEVWNAHDVSGIEALHAAKSQLHDWDGTHGPTNADVAKGIGGIWSSVPAIKIEIVDIYTCGTDTTCVANIKVVVDDKTTLKVCDVLEYDAAGKVVSLNAYLAK